MKTHKTCPSWGVTQCGKSLWPLKGQPPETTERWRNVTCKDCLRSKPKYRSLEKQSNGWFRNG